MKHKSQKLFISILIFIIALNIIPSVLGKTRGNYLTSFILNNEIEGEGFSNGILSSETAVSIEATSYAIEILDNYKINPHDIETLISKLEDDTNNILNNETSNVYDLFFILNSLKNLDPVIDSSISNEIEKYLNSTKQVTGGFSYSNNTKAVSLTSTYFCIRLYSLIEKPIENITIHKNWVLSCYNSDGGYGSNQSLSSTLVDTCFAVFILDELDELGALNNAINTLGYIQSFFVINSADQNNYGGYIPDKYSQYALLSSTYYSVKAVTLIDDSKLFKAIIRNWVLARQNFRDGGFAENSEGYQEKSSSVISSYYAFETLKILDSLTSLLNEIWTVEFNYWILIIILSSIGIIIAVVIILYKRTRL
ncbi:MAG: prenyltransferase/squalene oxidase repeat-containing protein [Candidatus Thorarchaeota archaeon]